MHPTIQDPRRNDSDLGQWLLAGFAALCLWGTLVVSGMHLHP